MPAAGIPALTLQHRLGGYREFAAPAALATVCEAVWSYRTPRVDYDSVHRVLPDPATSIEFTCRRDERGHPYDARILLLGPKTRPHLAAFEPGREMVAVKVKLEWTTAVVGVSPADHLDTVIDLCEVDAGLAASLEASLSDTLTIEAAGASLIAAVTQHVARRRPGAPGVAGRALDLVRRRRGRCSVGQIADGMAVSVRNLRRVVDRDARISLKTYARTLRLLHAVTMADVCSTRQLSWATVAVDAGFCDQAHLIRECQALCGLTPGEVVRERRTELDDEVIAWDRADRGTPTPTLTPTRRSIH